jgi:hypothetical protein
VELVELGLNYDTSNTSINKSGQPISIAAPSTPVTSQPLTQSTSTRGGVSSIPTINSMLNDIGRTTKPALANNATSNTPAVPVITPDTSITSPAQIGQRPNLPNSNSLTQPALASNVDPNKSYMTADNGVKTLNVAGGTISSSSPNFGNSSVKRLADLDQTLANDKNPDIIAHRAESAAMADQRYNNAYRNGLTPEQYNDPNGVTQLRKQFDNARASGDQYAAGNFQKMLLEQMGNATTARGQDIQNQNSQLTAQTDSARLGYDITKDAQSFEAAQKNKGIDQSIEVQKAQANNEKNFAEQINNPQTMFAEKSVPQSFMTANRAGVNTWNSLDNIVGPSNAERVRAETDPNKQYALLKAYGLDDDMIKLMGQHKLQR